MQDLHLQELTSEELKAVYETEMTRDFQPDERKPLAMIEAARDRGEYAACGIFVGESRVGYAFFVQIPGMQLLDYFAVQPELRCKGIGCAFLHLLKIYCGTGCLLLETEDPDHISGAEAERRLRFYLRNGCRDTGYRAAVWGVPYRILLLAGNTDDPAAVYAQLYRHMLPAHLFETKITIRKA